MDNISNEQLGLMLDEFEIKKVAHRFARGLDRADKDMIQSCFHPDGTDDHGIFQGSASDFCDWVMNALENYRATQHIISTQNAEISGNKAVCESYFFAHHLMDNDAGSLEIIASGRYVDAMEKRDGVWKIKHRQAIFDWNRMGKEAPTPSNPKSHLMTKGTKGEGDKSYEMFNALLS